jgi:CRISPR-associated protein (TIGR02584 family)
MNQTILLAVTGMSPAVLTETVWALAGETEPVVPHRVIVITTSEGRAAIERALFTPVPEWGNRTVWQTLRDTIVLRLGLTGSEPVLNFEPVRVFTAPGAASGRTVELDDLRTRKDNDHAADYLLEQVRGLVENPDTRVVASLAGGRKTMGALLYACMNLVGRETDRLTHVLVNEPYDTVPGFWFPDQPGGRITRPSRGPAPALTVDPAEAVVEMADVPFVPLRNLFQKDLGRKPGTFSRLVDTCREDLFKRAARDLRIVIDATQGELQINELTLKPAPAGMLVLLFLARHAADGNAPYSMYKEALDDLNAFRTKEVSGKLKPNDWRHAGIMRSVWGEREFIKAVADLRDKLQALGGDGIALAGCLPVRGQCGLRLPPANIRIQGLARP